MEKSTYVAKKKDEILFSLKLNVGLFLLCYTFISLKYMMVLCVIRVHVGLGSLKRAVDE